MINTSKNRVKSRLNSSRYLIEDLAMQKNISETVKIIHKKSEEKEVKHVIIEN